MTDKQGATADDKQPQEPIADEKPQAAAAETEPETAETSLDEAAPATPNTPTPDTEAPSTPTPSTEAPVAEAPAAAAEAPAKEAPVAEPQTVRIEAPAAADEPVTAVLPTVRISRSDIEAPPRRPAEPATVVIPAVEKSTPQPEPATVVIPAVEPPHVATAPEPAPALDSAQPVPADRAHTPPNGRVLLLIGAAVVVLIALIAGGLALAGNNSQDNSPTAQVTRTVNTYAKALAAGDLPTLRSVTTGSLQNYYNTVPDQQFAEVYQTSLQQKEIPTLKSVDAVEVDGNTAKAQFSTGDGSHPGPSYSLDLAQTASGWKITNPR